MKIVFKKEPNKPPVMRCIRADGSETWMCSKNQGAYFAVHDMLHYAVETVMGYATAFYGMVAGGRDLDDFGADIPHTGEAFMAEELVGVIQGLRQDGEITFEVFEEAAVLRWPSSEAWPSVSEGERGTTLHSEPAPSAGRGGPVVSREQLAGIVSLWDRLTAEWREMAEGEMVLEFPPGAQP